MNDRHTADSITSDALDALYDGLDGAYRERAHLLAWLAALHPAVIAPALDIDDEEGWQILYLYSSAHGWQMTWHIAPRDADLFKDVEHVDFADPRAAWDGHSTEQKYNRMRTHVRVVQMNNRLGATSCPVCEGTGRCPSCHTTMRAASFATGGMLTSEQYEALKAKWLETYGNNQGAHPVVALRPTSEEQP